MGPPCPYYTHLSSDPSLVLPLVQLMSKPDKFRYGEHLTPPPSYDRAWVQQPNVWSEHCHMTGGVTSPPHLVNDTLDFCVVASERKG